MRRIGFIAGLVCLGLGIVDANASPKKPDKKSVSKPLRQSPSSSLKKSQPLKKDDRIHITSDYLKYDRKGKMALATGHVKIVQEETIIRTAEVQFDQNAKISYMNQPVEVTQDKPDEPPVKLNSNRMTTFHKEKRLIAEGDVRFVKSRDPLAKAASGAKRDKIKAAIKKEDTVITSEELEYWTQKKDAHFKRKVTMVNGKKKAWGDAAFMDQTKDETRLNGNVKVVQINGNWLIKEGIVEADTPDEARDEALRERATLWCDTLVIDNKTSDAVATGEVVRIEQKGKVATGKRAVFSDRQNLITLTEQVRIQQANGDWLTAARAVFNTQTEVFEAFSGNQKQVQTEFSPPKENPATKQADDKEQVELDVDLEGQNATP
ncbi:MAG: LptA/OstA family protein [Candidatus Sericytochromatia bacterium]|nr:LptA/OstA family protein [Candidatus Sericytochromatia bacterium]